MAYRQQNYNNRPNSQQSQSHDHGNNCQRRPEQSDMHEENRRQNQLYTDNNNMNKNYNSDYHSQQTNPQSHRSNESNNKGRFWYWNRGYNNNSYNQSGGQYHSRRNDNNNNNNNKVQSYVDRVKNVTDNNENNVPNRHNTHHQNTFNNQLNEHNNNNYNADNYRNYQQTNDGQNRSHQHTQQTNYSVDNTNDMNNNDNTHISYDININNNTNHIDNNNNNNKNNYALDNPSEEYKVYNEHSHTHTYNSNENNPNYIDNNDHEYKDNENRNNYHRNSNNNQNHARYPSYYEKFADCPLSFDDQIYLIFKNCEAESLHFDQIYHRLVSQFNTPNVEYADIKNVRFLYLTGNNRFSMYLRFDDICPNGFECPMPRKYCHRIHFVTKFHICREPFQYKLMSCGIDDCRKIHIPARPMTTTIIEIILCIFKKHSMNCRNTLSLKDFYIKDHEFINTFNECYPHPPIPNINPATWQRIIRKYNKFYIDYKQQLNEPLSRGQYRFEFLWKTYNIGPGTSWQIGMYKHHSFFIDRTCSDALNKSCKFNPKAFCPYYHFHPAYVTMHNQCDGHSSGHPCPKFHIKCAIDLLQKPDPLPANSWHRKSRQVNKEIELQLKQINTTNIDIIDMDQNDIDCHNKWCNNLESIFEKQNEHFMHGKKDSIGIIYQSTMNESKPLQMVDKLYKFFNYWSIQNEEIVDIYYGKIQKNIILEFKVRDVPNICFYLASYISGNPKRWCFGRRIALKCTVEYINNNDRVLIFEFENVNLFLSIRLLKQWFMNLLAQTIKGNVIYNTYFGNPNSFQFIKGDYYFIKTNKVSAYNAVAYFQDAPLDLERVYGPRIDNIEIELQSIPVTQLNQNIHNDDSNFINYGKPQIYTYLMKSNHNINKNAIPVRNQQTQQQPQSTQPISSMQTVHNQPPQLQMMQPQSPQRRPQPIKSQRPSPPRHAPQTLPIQPPIQPLIQNNSVNYDYDDTDSSSVSQTPMNNQQPNLSNVQQDNNGYDYSDEDSSSETINAEPIYEEKEQWKPKWPDCNEKDCNYCKPLGKNETIEVNVSQLWVARHKKYGNAYKGNENITIYPVEEKERYCHVHHSRTCKHRIDAFEKLNNLCRYCHLAPWSDQHKQECWFIPNFIKQGKDEPDEEIKNETTFIGFRHRG